MKDYAIMLIILFAFLSLNISKPAEIMQQKKTVDLNDVNYTSYEHFMDKDGICKDLYIDTEEGTFRCYLAGTKQKAELKETSLLFSWCDE